MHEAGRRVTPSIVGTLRIISSTYLRILRAIVFCAICNFLFFTNSAAYLVLLDVCPEKNTMTRSICKYVLQPALPAYK